MVSNPKRIPGKIFIKDPPRGKDLSMDTLIEEILPVKIGEKDFKHRENHYNLHFLAAMANHLTEKRHTQNNNFEKSSTNGKLSIESLTGEIQQLWNKMSLNTEKKHYQSNSFEFSTYWIPYQGLSV